jgi:hypothetical protein
MMLQSDDWQTLKARKRLVTYLIEKTKAGHCGHLILYRRLAKIVLNMFQDTDRSANPFNGLRRGFADDPDFHELMLAQLIKKTDLDLRRMIEAEKIDFDNKSMDICKLYARLVIGHEDDLDCDTILKEIRVGLQQLQAEVSVPFDETCR